MRSCLFLCGLLLLLGAARALWLPVQLGTNRWVALREVQPGQFWLRPQCRLQTSQERGCDKDWLVTIRFWSWGLISRVQKALDSTQACRNATCTVSPFQTVRLVLLDQRAQWVADEVRFVNGPLPSAVQFRMRPGRAAGGNCSFRASSLVVQLQGGLAGAVFGFEVRRAFHALQPFRADLSLVRVMRQLAEYLVRQRAPDAAPGAVKRLESALAGWASRQELQRGAAMFARFPLLAQLRVGGVTSAPEVQRFSVLPGRRKEDEEGAKSKERQQSSQAPPRNDTALAELQSRISDLEAAIADLSCAPTALCSQPTANHSRLAKKRKSSSTAPEIDSCAGAAAGVFFLRPIRRYVRCSAKGELLVLYRRKGDVLFNRSFADYRRGFGDARKGDYWLGLDFVANYTAQGDVCARFQLTPWRLKLAQSSIQYSDFEVASRARGYRLWYTASRGKGIGDALDENKGRSFSTYDRDRDAFVGNCAQIFGGGGWFNSCARANIFGKIDVLSSRCMCWRGLPSQGDMCAPLIGFSLALRKASHGKGAKKIVFSLIANNTAFQQSNRSRYGYYTTASPRSSSVIGCQPTRQLFTIKGTGRYTLTVAGAPGGRSAWNVVGGRGALVQAQVVLKAGTILAVVAGCPGENGILCGHGGDASWIVDLGSQSLLVAAGGGGGGGRITWGRHGSAYGHGDIANEIYSNETLTVDHILGKNIKSRGLGWTQVFPPLMNGGKVSSGAKSKSRGSRPQSYYYRGSYRMRYTYKNADVLGGGGGGGFTGGVSGYDIYSGGGGGGSFCSPIVACDLTTGGNFHNSGYVLIEKQTCF